LCQVNSLPTLSPSHSDAILITASVRVVLILLMLPTRIRCLVESVSMCDCVWMCVGYHYLITGLVHLYIVLCLQPLDQTVVVRCYWHSDESCSTRPCCCCSEYYERM